MTFRSQEQAKQFFIDKILFQAQKDRVILSDAEQYMLGWSESERAFELNKKLSDEFREQTSDQEYERRISTLIKRAYDADIQNDPALGQTYHAAYQCLKQGDYYILIMIEKALQGYKAAIKTDAWLKDKILLILVGLGITLVPFMIAVYFNFSKQWASFMSACIFLYLFPFGLYSYSIYRTAKTKGTMSATRTIIFPLVIATIAICMYVYLIVQFNIIDIAAHESDRIGFRLIVSAPLLVVSIFILDVALQRGILYDNIAEYLQKLKRKN